MKIKDGLLALVVAAALGSTGVYAQGPTSHGVTPGDTSLPDPTQTDQHPSTLDSSASQQSSAIKAPSESSSSQMQSSAVSADERARAGDSSSMSHMQAQSNVPPPVDSDTVRNIQQALSDQGHKVNTDGIWGDRTHEALKEFQSDKHLNATGQLDGETFAALGLTDASQQTASASSASQQSATTETKQQEDTAEQQAKIESGELRGQSSSSQ